MLGEMSGRSVAFRVRELERYAIRCLPKITRLCKKAAKKNESKLQVIYWSIDQSLISLPNGYSPEKFYAIVAEKMGISWDCGNRCLRWDERDFSDKVPIDPDF